MRRAGRQAGRQGEAAQRCGQLASGGGRTRGWGRGGDGHPVSPPAARPTERCIVIALTAAWGSAARMSLFIHSRKAPHSLFFKSSARGLRGRGQGLGEHVGAPTVAGPSGGPLPGGRQAGTQEWCSMRCSNWATVLPPRTGDEVLGIQEAALFEGGVDAGRQRGRDERRAVGEVEAAHGQRHGLSRGGGGGGVGGGGQVGIMAGKAAAQLPGCGGCQRRARRHLAVGHMPSKANRPGSRPQPGCACEAPRCFPPPWAACPCRQRTEGRRARAWVGA